VPRDAGRGERDGRLSVAAFERYLRKNYLDTDELNRQVLLECAPPRPGAALLDLGCADGAFTLRLAARVQGGQAARVCGVEFRPDLAEAAERRGVEVTRANIAEGLPFPDDSFDVIHSNQVIEHLAETDRFLREIRRVLKPGGYALVSTNNLSSLHNVVSLLLGWQPMPSHVSDEVVGLGNPMNPFQELKGERGFMHLRLFTGRALADLARFHGFKVELARAAGFYPLPPVLARVAARIAPVWGAYLVQRYSI
jgi:SAM-dependent methyltransferase